MRLDGIYLINKWGDKMKNFEASLRRSLEWKRPRVFTREHILFDGDRPLATLQQLGFTGKHCQIITHDDRNVVLEVNRYGIFRRSLFVKWADPSLPQVLRSSGKFGGDIEIGLDNGRIFHWRRLSFWRNEWAIADEVGRPLIRFRPHTLRSGGVIGISPFEFGTGEMALLLLVGWYLIVLERQDAAVAALAGAGH